MDNIVIIASDQDDIQRLKQHLFHHFQTKDLGKLKYFLGIEITQSNSSVVLSQWKYVLDILEEICMLDYKHVDTYVARTRVRVSGTSTYLRVRFVNSQNLEYGDTDYKYTKFGYGCREVFDKNKEILYKFYTFI